MSVAVEIPAQIKQAGDEAAKVRDAILAGKPVEGAPTPTPNPPPATPTEPVVVPADAKAALEGEITALTQRRDQVQREIDQLNGSYGSRIKSLSDQVKTLTERLTSVLESNADLQSRLTALSANGGTPTPGGDPNSPDYKAILGEEFMEQYGSDLPEGVTKLINDILQKRLGPITEDVEHVRAAARKRESESAEHDFYESLKAEGVADPRAVNADPGWWAFLDTINPDTGESYRLEAEHAMSRGNARHIATLMKKFRGGATPPPPATPPRKLEDEVVPKQVRAGGDTPPGDPGQKPILTWDQWNAFENELKANPNRYSVEHVNRRNEEFRTALREGRLR